METSLLFGRSETLLLAGAALVLAAIAHTAWSWYRLSHVPGPFWASLSKYWMVKESIRGRQPIAIKEAIEKYGSLIRIGPNDVITDDPEVVKRITAVRSKYTRGPWYGSLRNDPSRDNLLTLRDEVAHTKLRAKMAPGYSGKENLYKEDTIDTQVTNFVSLIETKYISDSVSYRPLDLGEKAQFFTLDVISDLAFGKAFGFLTQDVDVYNFLKITDAFVPVMLILANVPVVTSILQSRLFRGLFPKETDKLGFGAFIGIARNIVAERFEKTDASAQSDMLGSFMRHGLTQDQVATESLLQVLAGSDTTASAIRFTMLHLLANPPAYQKLVREIDEGIASGNISSPIKDSEARQMPYLQAVIKEGLRVMPPVGAALYKTVPEGGDVIDGKFLPAGTEVGISPLSMQHSKKIYGEDAELFVPERWIVVDEDKYNLMTNTADLVFYSGRYQCLGKSIALMELNKVYVELLRRFNFSLGKPLNPAIVQNAGIWIIKDLTLRITRREI